MKKSSFSEIERNAPADQPSNQSMKPNAPSRLTSRELVTTPCVAFRSFIGPMLTQRDILGYQIRYQFESMKVHARAAFTWEKVKRTVSSAGRASDS